MITKTRAARRNWYGYHYSPIQDHLLSEWTEKLRDGKRGNEGHGLAQAMINDFIVRTGFDKPQSKYMLHWLAEVLDEILDNGKPDARRAFALLPRREGGRQTVSEAIDIAGWVKLAIKRGYSEAEACKKAAETFHRDVKHIQRQRKRALNWTKNMNPETDWDEIYLEKRRPLPPARKGSKPRT